MNKTSVHFSSKSNEWETPSDLFKKLDDEFCFNLDPCATKENAKCEEYFTIEDNGLNREWHGSVFMNPPYGREIGKWISKAYFESLRNGCRVVCLVPARTDTAWFHDYIYPHAREMRFLRGRLYFNDGKGRAPFPSMIVIFGKK